MQAARGARGPRGPRALAQRRRQSRRQGVARGCSPARAACASAVASRAAGRSPGWAAALSSASWPAKRAGKRPGPWLREMQRHTGALRSAPPPFSLTLPSPSSPRAQARMSLQRTSKLLSYVNYRMRVTVVDGRQIVGRWAPAQRAPPPQPLICLPASARGPVQKARACRPLHAGRAAPPARPRQRARPPPPPRRPPKVHGLRPPHEPGAGRRRGV